MEIEKEEAWLPLKDGHTRYLGVRRILELVAACSLKNVFTY